MRHKPAFLALAAILAFTLTALAQTKRPFTHQDFDAWKSIQAQQLSRDGKWVAYALMPQDGDGEIIVRNIASGTEWKTKRGYRPPQPPPDPSEPGPAPALGQALRTLRPVFTADSRFLLFTIEPTKAELNQAKKDKKKPEEMPKNALAIMNLSNGQVTRIEKVKSFQSPEDAAGWVAYQLEANPEDKKPEAEAPKPGEDTEDQQRGGRAVAGGRPSGNRKEFGSDLVLRNLTTGAERTFAHALDFSFSKDAKALVYTVAARAENLNGVFIATPGNDSPPVELLAGKGKYTRLTWDEGQTQLAFTSDRDEAGAKQPKFKIYHWTRNSNLKAVEIVSTANAGFRSGLIISDNANLSFSQDGSKLFLGVAPPSEPEKDPNSDDNSDDKVSVDLWHYQDDFIQPMQKVRAGQERNRSYRAVYHLKEKKFVQLADETMNGLNPADKGSWALGTDDREYRRLVGVDTNYSDVYLVNTTDGTRKPLLKKNQFGVTWSPNGKYGLVFDGKDWNTISVPDGKLTNLTAKLGVKFWREDHDSPSTAPAYGNGGWVKDDKAVLLYDQFDIWQVAPDGSSAKNLTDGVGRKEKIEFRYAKLDSEDRFIDPSKPLLLRAENVETRDSGFYRDKLDGGLPERLHWAAKNFTNPTKAKDADVLLLTASRFDEYPDLLVTNSNLKYLKKGSNAGEQLNKFTWGRAELVRFRNTDGVALSGILVKPENFDPSKKYPMIVYIYEKLSNTLHNFTHPTPTNSINRYVYASNGYLVFMPDIVYTIGYPGQSAMKCVMPGVQAVVDQGFVDENAIGIQGHSWGGYQIAYMVTQTNRFKAAAPGAVVANMTSAYSGIRWGTGLSRQFQYEHTQSRIGGSLWEYPMRFLENSPVFRADRVQTPVLMIHNDADDAVPWYQGIEFFLALRRLNKEAYMFSYNGEPHNLRKRQNQKDYTRRMLEFFEYELKGAPKPEWMEKGIPYLQREKEKEKYKTVSDAK
jgi:dipeptidyl aminopeptidase/acylaminoacyl peptidase